MNSLIKNSLANLKNHKFRVFVALVWIIIGITSVVVVSSIGNGLEAQVRQSVSQIAENKTTIYFETTDYGVFDMGIFLKPFRQSDIEALSFVEGVEKIGPSQDGYNMETTYYTDAYFDKKSSPVEIAPMKETLDITPTYGRKFTLDDENRKVIILTMESAMNLFENPEDALGRGIELNGMMFEIIGIVDEGGVVDNEEKKENDLYMGDYFYLTSYAPKKAFDSLNSQYTYASEIYSLDLIATKGYNVYDVAYSVIDRLCELHPDINGTYTTPDPSDQNNELEMMTSQINNFVKIIIVIAMIVGGVGVMNIMYVSVMERQREIGIRRAIGAKPSTILFQFLVESTFITVCGGILGMIVGYFAIGYVGTLIGFAPIPKFSTFVYAALTTVLTGVVFGIVPAVKAARLDPIKAIYK